LYYKENNFLKKFLENGLVAFKRVGNPKEVNKVVYIHSVVQPARKGY